MDEAHKETDKLLANMEKKLDGVYKQAYREARETANEFTAQFRKMDEKKRQEVKDGELDVDEYNRWRRTKVFQSNRYHQMADTLAADMTNVNKMAASVINGYLPEVYAINHNYGTYEVEHGAKVNTQYTLYDRQTVERLMRDDPDLLPMKAKVNVPKDLLWNKKNINSAVTQGILQGEPIDKISQRLAATVTDMSHNSAVRSARTMTTSAENGGRVDSYKRAESMGISMVQVWLATLDGRTRHEHRQLDGQKRPVGEPFEVDGYKLDFPADPKAEPFLVYNCRCTLIAQVKGVNMDLSDVTQRDSKLGTMSYEQWKEEKSKEKAETEPKIHKKSLDFGNNSDIIKAGHKMSADSGFTLKNKQYEVKDSPEQVKASYKYAKEVLGVGNVKFDNLKNNEVIQPMLEQVNILKEKHGKCFYQIFVDDTMSDSDFAEVAPDLSLHLNAKYMNSKEATAEIIKSMISERQLPKGLETTEYIITHEYMHFITRTEVDDLRSKAQKVIPDEETRIITAPSANAMINKNEYVADAMAVVELGTKSKYKQSHWNLWSKIYNYFLKEG